MTVTGADDSLTDGDVSWNVRLDPSSTADSDYNGLSNVDVLVTTLDDEGAAVVSGVTFASSPASGDTYVTGDSVEVRVDFDQIVDVTGTPRLALTIDSATRQAACASGTGRKTLVFRYTVSADDWDSNGISVGANALTLNSGAIDDARNATTPASLGLGTNALDDSTSHKVSTLRQRRQLPGGLRRPPPHRLRQRRHRRRERRQDRGPATTP